MLSSQLQIRQSNIQCNLLDVVLSNLQKSHDRQQALQLSYHSMIGLHFSPLSAQYLLVICRPHIEENGQQAGWDPSSEPANDMEPTTIRAGSPDDSKGPSL